jgi:hypothetical protein
LSVKKHQQKLARNKKFLLKKFGNLEIWKFGNLEIWKFGNLEIWKFGNFS